MNTTPDYYEVRQGAGKTTFNFYTAEQYGAELVRRRKARAEKRKRMAKTRRLRLFRETIGGLVLLMGFVVTIAAGGCGNIGEILITTGCGAVLIGLGGWLAHIFPGQERKAEWRRRLSRAR